MREREVDGMQFFVHPMTLTDVEQIAAWRYEGQYAFYNMENDQEDLDEFTDPRNWENTYYAVTDEAGTLIGFYCLQCEGSTVVVGLGMRPDLTGKGLGLSFLETGLQFASEQFSASAYRLSVAAFNQRAINLYTKAGFQPTRTYRNRTNGGEYDFLEMTREARYRSADRKVRSGAASSGVSIRASTSLPCAGHCELSAFWT